MSAIFSVVIRCDKCGMGVRQSAPFPVGADAEHYRNRLDEAGWTVRWSQPVNGCIIADYCPECSKKVQP